MCGAERRYLISIPTALLLACGVAQGASAIAVTNSEAPGEPAIARAMTGKWPDASTDMRDAKAAPELDVYCSGNHGFSMMRRDGTSDHWIDELYWWMASYGLTEP